MKSDLPKVLHPLLGKPLISYVIENLKKANINKTITIIGHKGDLIKEELGSLTEYAWQHEQLGTGHAVMQAEENLTDFQGKIIVACGDVPLITKETYQSLIEKATESNTGAVVLTMDLKNPNGYGRIVKDENGNFLRIVEEKDSNENEKKITEVNSGTYIFNKEFLFDGLKLIDTNNAQGEYYLPDALNYVLNQNHEVKTLQLTNPIEGSGINSKKDLAKITEYLNKTK
jgi:bifunctional UDP-N-acetylglucosamine pyrophosphorylase / glucosamine-1-phosphate N-acetyltransferase